MKRLLTFVAFFATLQASAQQVNPVPDYVFRNQMSVGRNAVTDTAAYFSIGPRYGATKGFMPPIVGDTATFSSGKRNGLLIFSVQKNKFLYWDSVRVQWSDMAGGSGSYILAGDTSAMLAPYLRKADTTAMLLPYIRHAGYGLTKSGQSFLVDTLNIATRAWRQKGIDSVVSIIPAAGVGGSGTTNYVPKFTAGSTIGNSQIFDNGTNVGIGTASPTTLLTVNGRGTFTDANGGIIIGQYLSVPGFGGIYSTQVTPSGSNYNFLVSGTNTYISSPNGFIRFDNAGTERLRITSGGDVGIGTTAPNTKTEIFGGDARVTLAAGSAATFRGYQMGTGTTEFASLKAEASLGETRLTSGFTGFGGFTTFYNNGSERMRIFANGRVGINTTTDAGYQFDINGTLRSVNGANFATTSGNVGIGTETPLYKLDVRGAARSLNEMRVTSGSYLTNYNTSLRSDVSANGILQLGNNNINYILAGNTLAGGFLAIRVNVSDETLTSGSEAMRITSSGELLVNTTSDAGDYKLQVSGNIYNTGSAVLAATSGGVAIGTTTTSGKLNILGDNDQININTTGTWSAIYFKNAGADRAAFYVNNTAAYIEGRGSSGLYLGGAGATAHVNLNSNGELIIGTGAADAGDYKLQVVGNARIGTGKLDIASNTTFGLGVARSGTSEVAGQIYNSNGILYLGAESSAGGQIFSGSSAYAGVIGTGANYPLQFATNNITRATMTTSGNLLLGFTTDSYFLKLQVNGSIFSNNQVLAQGVNAQIAADSSTNVSPLYISNQSLTGSSAQGLFYGSTTWNTTGNPSLIDLNITNTASGATSNYIKISDGSNIFRVTKAAEVVTAAPTGGSIRKWKLGEAATVSPTSPNRTIRVEIDGTVYYLHAKTTND